MKLTKREIIELSMAMQEYDGLRQKDKQAEITEERLIKLSPKVKYTLRKNWNKLKGTAEAIEEVLNDKFVELGGKMNQNGTGTWIDPAVVEQLRLKYKKNRDKLSEEIATLNATAETASKQYMDFRKATLAEQEEEDFRDIRGIEPTEEDIVILPESLIDWYMDHLLLSEPEWEEETPDTEAPKKSKK